MDRESRRTLKKIIHELAQPLTTIKAFGYVAVNQLDSGPTDVKAVSDLVKKMVEAADFADELLERFHTTQVAENLQLGAVELKELVGKPVGMIEPQLRHYGVDLQLLDIPDCQVNVDAVQIQAALINLFRNSIESRRMEGNSKPLIKVEASVGNEWAEIVVADNGCGIPQELQDAMFQTRDSVDGRRGMGLSICKELVELHGGKIWHKDNSPAGAKFHLTLPLVGKETKTEEPNSVSR